MRALKDLEFAAKRRLLYILRLSPFPLLSVIFRVPKKLMFSTYHPQGPDSSTHVCFLLLQ